MRPEHSAAVGIRKGRCNNFVWDQRQRNPTASCYSSCEIIIIKKQNRREKRERKNLSWGIRAISALMSTWYRDCIYIDIKTDATDGPARGEERGGLMGKSYYYYSTLWHVGYVSRASFTLHLDMRNSEEKEYGTTALSMCSSGHFSWSYTTSETDLMELTQSP